MNGVNHEHGSPGAQEEGGGFDRQDRIVTGLGIGVFALAGLLLYVDTRAQSGPDRARVVGSLTRESGRVQRRASDRALWETAAATVPVFDREWIRTGEQANASINLEEGGSIVLESFSMITLYVRDRSPEVDLSEGSFLVEAPRGLRVRTRGGRSVLIQGNARLARTKGRLLVRASAQGARLFEGAQQRILTPGTEVEAERPAGPPAVPESNTTPAAAGAAPVNVRLLFPGPDSVVDMTVRESLPFRWSAVPGAARYRFTLRRGKRVLIAKDVAENAMLLTDLGLLDVGQFEWQVTATLMSPTTSEKAPTTTGRFRIILRTGPGRPELDLPEEKKR